MRNKMAGRIFDYSIRGGGIKLRSGRDRCSIDYTGDVLKNFGIENSERIAENLIYLLTVPFVFVQNKLHYKNRPFFEGLIRKGVLGDIPAIAEETDRDTNEFLASFNKTDITFGSDDAKKLSIKKDNDPCEVTIGMSFGKDSLLSFSLAKEIGLNINLVFFNDTEELDINEYKHKIESLKRFTGKLKEEVNIVYDNTDKIFSKKTKLIEEFTKTNAMLSYALEILPFLHKYRSRYIIFGNEQNFNDTFINKDGFKSYVSYDQTTEYMGAMNNAFDNFGGEFQVVSLIEPIYNIAEYKILGNRYKDILRYVMSCSGDDKEKWCYSCPMCAKTYVYSLAVGLDPKEMGFTENFFDKRFELFYPLFSKPISIYEKPQAVRDEQLLAFYLAYRNKCRGYLIERFKERFLKEAVEREDELHDRFFRIYDAVSIPTRLKQELNSIYREELSK